MRAKSFWNGGKEPDNASASRPSEEEIESVKSYSLRDYNVELAAEIIYPLNGGQGMHQPEIVSIEMLAVHDDWATSTISLRDLLTDILEDGGEQGSRYLSKADVANLNMLASMIEAEVEMFRANILTRLEMQAEVDARKKKKV